MPAFLRWVPAEGWDLIAPLPEDIVAKENLDSPDPWVVFGCVFQRCKLGEFTDVDHIIPLMTHQDGDLQEAAQMLVAAVGTSSQLVHFDALIAAPETPVNRMSVADNAIFSGSLRFVDVFIEGWKHSFGETTRAAMTQGLEELLGLEQVHNPDGPELQTRKAELAAEFGETTCFFEGKPLTLQAYVRRIEAHMTEMDELVDLVQAMMVRLQTMVGFSMGGMFKEHTTGVHWDERLIRDALDQSLKLESTPGMRLFWGHPAPL